jgi:hypothetical protein
VKLPNSIVISPLCLVFGVQIYHLMLAFEGLCGSSQVPVPSDALTSAGEAMETYYHHALYGAEEEGSGAGGVRDHEDEPDGEEEVCGRWSWRKEEADSQDMIGYCYPSCHGKPTTKNKKKLRVVVNGPGVDGEDEADDREPDAEVTRRSAADVIDRILVICEQLLVQSDFRKSNDDVVNIGSLCLFHHDFGCESSSVRAIDYFRMWGLLD